MITFKQQTAIGADNDVGVNLDLATLGVTDPVTAPAQELDQNEPQQDHPHDHHNADAHRHKHARHNNSKKRISHTKSEMRGEMQARHRFVRVHVTEIKDALLPNQPQLLHVEKRERVDRQRVGSNQGRNGSRSTRGRERKLPFVDAPVSLDAPSPLGARQDGVVMEMSVVGYVIAA